MEQATKKPLIKRLELSISGRWAKSGGEMAMHPVSIGRCRQCFALALDRR